MKTPIVFSSCMVDESNFLNANNIVNSHNIFNYTIKCSIYTGYNAVSDELCFIDSITGSSLVTIIDVIIERNYNMVPNIKENKVILKKTMLYVYNNIANPIFTEINYLTKPFDNCINYISKNGSELLDKSLILILSLIYKLILIFI